ncbi:hypothetical protein ACFLW7_02120 [Chloroflexota bacterium]
MEIFPNTQITDGAITEYHALMERVWDQRFLSEQLWEASKAFLKSEQAHRSAAFIEQLDFPREVTDYTEQERLFNRLGVEHLNAARDRLTRFMQTIPHMLEDIHVPDYKNELIFARIYFLRSIGETGMALDEGKTITEKYDALVEVAMDQGYASLLNNVIHEIETLAEYRLSETRGRIHASPLPVWKISLLAILAGTNIGAVIACFKTKRPAEFAGLSTSMGAWMAILVMLGC